MTRALALAVALACLAPRARAAEPVPSLAEAGAAQEAALQSLAEGNARFVKGAQAPHELGPARRHALARGQHPQAVVLSCSDSRVPPELVFDQQLGQVFVVRTAGNVADAVALGSIEYAVEHLGTPLVVVLGHRSCGAVTAAVATRRSQAPPHGNLGEVLKLVLPAVAEAEQAGAPDLVNAAIEANAALEARILVRQSPVIAEHVRSGSVRIVTAIYDLESGRVTFGN